MKQPNKICKTCGLPFYKPPCLNRIKFCSKECYWIGKRGKPLTDEWKNNISKGVKLNLPSSVWKKGERPSTKTEFKKGEHIGADHPNWNGGITTYRKKYLEKNKEVRCEICGENKKKIFIHHKDKNRKNNKLNNLIAVCSKCHGVLHRNFDYKKVCEWCNKEFESYRQNQRFCSVSCGLKHTHHNKQNGNS